MVLPELLLRLRGRGGVAVSVVGSELLARRNELLLRRAGACWAEGTSRLWWKVEAVGDSCETDRVGELGRDEDDGGRRKAQVDVSPRVSYSLVIDLTERLWDNAEALRLCASSRETADSALVELGARPLLTRLAERESDRMRSPAIVVVVVVVLSGDV